VCSLLQYMQAYGSWHFKRLADPHRGLGVLLRLNDTNMSPAIAPRSTVVKISAETPAHLRYLTCTRRVMVDRYVHSKMSTQMSSERWMD